MVPSTIPTVPGTFFALFRALAFTESGSTHFQLRFFRKTRIKRIMHPYASRALHDDNRQGCVWTKLGMVSPSK